MIPLDCTHVGFITPSIFQKSKRFRNCNELVAFLDKHYACMQMNKVIPLTSFGWALDEAMSYHSITFLHIWNNFLELMNLNSMKNRDFMALYCNHFILCREKAIEFLLFVQTSITVLSSKLNEPYKSLIMQNSKYDGNLLLNNEIEQRTGIPYYTYHAFLCERLSGLFASLHKLDIM